MFTSERPNCVNPSKLEHVTADLIPTEVLQLLVVLASLHLRVELVLIRAELQQILAGLVAIGLKKVLNPI